MITITFPLKLRMKSPEVGDLQDALQLLVDNGLLLKRDEALRREVVAAMTRERVDSTFANATRRAVAAFQEEHQLEASGAVDERTANAIMAVLRDLGRPGVPGPAPA